MYLCYHRCKLRPPCIPLWANLHYGPLWANLHATTDDDNGEILSPKSPDSVTILPHSFPHARPTASVYVKAKQWWIFPKHLNLHSHHDEHNIFSHCPQQSRWPGLSLGRSTLPTPMFWQHHQSGAVVPRQHQCHSFTPHPILLGPYRTRRMLHTHHLDRQHHSIVRWCQRMSGMPILHQFRGTWNHNFPWGPPHSLPQHADHFHDLHVCMWAFCHWHPQPRYHTTAPQWANLYAGPP